MRAILNWLSCISFSLVFFMVVGHWNSAWAGGDPTSLKEKEPLSRQIPAPVQTPSERMTTTPSYSQSSPQPLTVTQSNPQDATSESPFTYNSMTKPGKLEFGVIGGDPMGLSAKLWLSPTRALDAGLGWNSFDDDTNLQLHADYLFHEFGLIQPKSGLLPVYAGMGARFRFGDDTRFGFRVPVGVQYITDSRTISLFVEAAPVIDFIPDAEVDVNFGVGIRFFFFEPDTQSRNPR